MSTAGAFAVPQFRRYYLGAVAATNATWIFRVLLAWSAWDLTGSASFVGLVAAAGLLPVAVFGPLFGAATDRTEIVRAFRLASTGLLISPLMLLGLYGLNWLAPIPLLILSVSYGVILAAYHPLRQSMGPRLVDPPLIGSVVALAALNFNVGRLLAPAIGGLLIAQAGEEVTALVSAAMFAPSILIAATLSPRPNTRTGPRGSFLSDLRAGFSIAWERWPVRRALLLSVFALGPVRALTELLTLIADGRFGRGAEGLGLLTSAVGFGALIAAVFQVFAGQTLLRKITLRYGVVTLGFVAGILMTGASRFDLVILAAAVTGFCGTYVGVSLQIGLQARLEDGLRGRVMSLWMLATTLSTSVLALTISVLSEGAGLNAATIWVFIASAGVVAAIALWRHRE